VNLFIAGTDTGAGKTHLATRPLRLLRESGVSCAGMKPICCGDRRDAELLFAAGGDGVLQKILDVPLPRELGENLTQLPADWRFILR